MVVRQIDLLLSTCDRERKIREGTLFYETCISALVIVLLPMFIDFENLKFSQNSYYYIYIH